ncbi:MAG: hypothetical protein WCR42_09410 [bacterium]
MKTLNIKLNLIMLFIITITVLSITSCRDKGTEPDPNDAGNYQIIPKYDSVRTYAGGGGIYVVRISPSAGFEGTVKLKLEADPKLNALLMKTTLTKNDTIAEIVIKPSSAIEIKAYTFNLVCSHANSEKRYQFKAAVYDLQNTNYEPCLEKLNLFKNWIQSEKPEFASIFDTPARIYMTYPEIMIVEHWTLISTKYEIRFCFHVMVPPDDWSKIQIRKLGKLEPEFSAHRDSYGNITIIPNSEYPTFFGY